MTQSRLTSSHLVGAPRLIQMFVTLGRITGHCDADFDGCLRTRASTSCARASAAQRVAALGSAVSEFYCFDVLPLVLEVPIWRQLLEETALLYRRVLRGAEKVRHAETGNLWLQKHVTDRRVEFEQESCKTNVADLVTKRVLPTLLRHLQSLSFDFKGRSGLSLEIASA